MKVILSRYLDYYRMNKNIFIANLDNEVLNFYKIQYKTNNKKQIKKILIKILSHLAYSLNQHIYMQTTGVFFPTSIDYFNIVKESIPEFEPDAPDAPDEAPDDSPDEDDDDSHDEDDDAPDDEPSDDEYEYSQDGLIIGFMQRS